VTLLRCQRVWMPNVESVGQLAYRVWGLEALGARYRDFHGRIEALLDLLERVGQVEDVDAEAVFFQAMGLQQEFLDIFAEDPCLPVELLPSDWPGHHAHELFHALTCTIDQLELPDSRYEYLLRLIQGMEVVDERCKET
jgi:DNA-binding transcriptional regulator PaaX